jgi:hypothetical protein
MEGSCKSLKESIKNDVVGGKIRIRALHNSTQEYERFGDKSKYRRNPKRMDSATVYIRMVRKRAYKKKYNNE